MNELRDVERAAWLWITIAFALTVATSFGPGVLTLLSLLSLARACALIARARRIDQALRLRAPNVHSIARGADHG